MTGPDSERMEARIDELEIQISHQNALLEELNSVVADQWKEIDRLKMLTDALLGRVRDMMADQGGDIPEANVRPPHW